METVHRPEGRMALGLLAVVVAAGAIAGLIAFLDGGRQTGAAAFEADVSTLAVREPVRWEVPTGEGFPPLVVFGVRQPGGEIHAFVARDPHGGCEVVWVAGYDAAQVNGSGLGAFKALCTGWVFDTTGAVLFGAAERGLDRVVLTLSSDGKSARIDLGQFILGLCRDWRRFGCSTPDEDVTVAHLPDPRVRLGQGN